MVRIGTTVLAALLLLAAVAAPSFAQTPCDRSPEPLDALRTRQQLKRFVQCAIDHIRWVGWTEAVEDFRSDGNWRWWDGSVYLFAGDLHGAAIRFVAGSEIAPGTDLSTVRDSNGHYFVRDIARVARDYGSGFVYYRSSESGVAGPHISYVKLILLDGEKLFFGAGVYSVDAPGACPAERVKAALVTDDRSLEQFVNCAAELLRRQGRVALTEFEIDPRWISGSIYLFVIDPETLETVFDAAYRGQWATYRGTRADLTAMERIVRDYGDGYVYDWRRNPATGDVEPKASYVREVLLDGRSYILGAGRFITTRTTPAVSQRATIDEPLVWHADDEVADIAVEGSTLIYQGKINAASFARFLSVVDAKEDGITTFRVESTGGDTRYGRKLGNWIFERGLHVVVQNACLSSCANYLFTAGSTKTILADAIVAWHGSDQQWATIAHARGLSFDEYVGELYDEHVGDSAGTASDYDRKKYMNLWRVYGEQAVDEERAFMDRIGVDSAVLIYGMLPARFDDYFGRPVSGWTFTIEDMEAFGIGNLNYEGDGEYPSAAAKRRHNVVVYEVHD